ncbi:MAG: acetylxylan esterase [Opitutus sp.]|nr:acetylxylan esterase [Opitutus sp.]
MKIAVLILVFVLAAFGSNSASATDRKDVNHDEAKVGPYTLPDPLMLNNGQPVRNAQTWSNQRRGELLELFRANVYGRSPGRPTGMTFQETRVDRGALNGLATRKEITVLFTGSNDGPKMTLMLYVPNGEAKPAPAFLGLNFYGNHSVDPDTSITLSPVWVRATPDDKVVNHRATAKSHGMDAARWQLEKVLRRGYVTATVYYGELEPDQVEGWKTGVRGVPALGGGDASGATRKPDAWGAIAAWAWGLSRAMDYLETDRDIDAQRVAVHGLSRLGKTSLWAGATDERFALVISNESGEGGAALARRDFGENTQDITADFPHWFCLNYNRFVNNIPALPVDQHELIALMAPRPVYVSSAEDDAEADPRGEFLAAKNAESVYALFQKPGLGVADQPKVNQPVGNFIGYHIRTGKHDITSYDWDQFLNFADRHFLKQ